MIYIEPVPNLSPVEQTEATLFEIRIYQIIEVMNKTGLTLKQLAGRLLS